MKEKINLIISPFKSKVKILNSNQLFLLGQWCENFFYQKNNFINAKIIPYHWDDREKLLKDYNDLNFIYEEFLDLIKSEMNNLHNVNFSKKYWRIFIGPWLFHFIHIIFDRWSMLNYTFKNYEVDEVYAATSNLDIIPNDFRSFQNMMTTELWNTGIYIELIKNFIDPKKLILTERYNLPKDKIKIKNKKNYFTQIFSLINYFSKSDDIFFINPYLKKSELFKLQIKLKQIPQYYEDEELYLNSEYNEKFRNWKILNSEDNQFKKILKHMILKFMPICHLEGYKELIMKVNKSNWPKNPKIIFTSSSHIHNDKFKLWCAEKVENKTKLIIGQHGGGLTTSLFSSHFDHELNVADKYLAWGKETFNIKKIVSFFNFKMIGRDKNLKKKDTKKILIILNSYSQYSYALKGSIISSQYSNYLQNIFEIIKAISTNKKIVFKLRLHKEDYDWYTYDRIKEKFSDVEIDKGENDCLEEMKESSLCISTTNTTTYLESLYLNIPTLIYFDKKFDQVSLSAQKDFDKLRKIGLFYDDPQELSKKINQISSDIPSWWKSNLLEKEVFKFKENYTRKSKNITKELSNFFLDELNKK
jgi:putative transferase (TIGR04331 family)